MARARGNTVRSVQSFNPKLLALLVKGAKERTEVELNSTKAAITLRARLHSLRSVLRKTGHPMISVIESCIIQIQGTKLVARPADEQFLDALEQAGVTDSYLPDTQNSMELQQQVNEIMEESTESDDFVQPPIVTSIQAKPRQSFLDILLQIKEEEKAKKEANAEVDTEADIEADTKKDDS